MFHVIFHWSKVIDISSVDVNLMTPDVGSIPSLGWFCIVTWLCRRADPWHISCHWTVWEHVQVHTEMAILSQNYSSPPISPRYAGMRNARESLDGGQREANELSLTRVVKKWCPARQSTDARPVFGPKMAHANDPDTLTGPGNWPISLWQKCHRNWPLWHRHVTCQSHVDVKNHLPLATFDMSHVTWHRQVPCQKWPKEGDSK